MPINPNENSILTPQRPVPDARLGCASTGQSKKHSAAGKGCCEPGSGHSDGSWRTIFPFCEVPLLVRKRFQEPVGDGAHLSNRVVDHAISFDPGCEANRNVQLAVGFLRIAEQLLGLPDLPLDTGKVIIRIVFRPDRCDSPVAATP